jgi:hypothetical protein
VSDSIFETYDILPTGHTHTSLHFNNCKGKLTQCLLQCSSPSTELRQSHNPTLHILHHSLIKSPKTISLKTPLIPQLLQVMPQSTHSLFPLSQILESIRDGQRESLNGMLDLVIVRYQRESEIAILQHLVEDGEITEWEAEVLDSRAYVQVDN